MNIFIWTGVAFAFGLGVGAIVLLPVSERRTLRRMSEEIYPLPDGCRALLLGSVPLGPMPAGRQFWAVVAPGWPRGHRGCLPPAHAVVVVADTRGDVRVVCEISQAHRDPSVIVAQEIDRQGAPLIEEGNWSPPMVGRHVGQFPAGAGVDVAQELHRLLCRSHTDR